MKCWRAHESFQKMTAVAMTSKTTTKMAAMTPPTIAPAFALSPAVTKGLKLVYIYKSKNAYVYIF